MAEPIRGEAKGAVLEVTLDCPPANAIDLSVSRARYSAIVRLRDDAGLRVGSSRPRHRRSFFAGLASRWRYEPSCGSASARSLRRSRGIPSDIPRPPSNSNQPIFEVPRHLFGQLL